MPAVSSKQSDHYLHSVKAEKVESQAVQDRMHRFVNIAKALFSNGACSHGRTMNFTFVTRKSKLICIGQNDYRRQMSGYVKLLKTRYLKFGEKTYTPSLHAELSAILRLGLEDCSDLDFYNIRIDKNKHCKNSCCCANCFRTLNIVGFKHIYFYDEDMNICQILG